MYLSARSLFSDTNRQSVVSLHHLEPVLVFILPPYPTPPLPTPASAAAPDRPVLAPRCTSPPRRAGHGRRSVRCRITRRLRTAGGHRSVGGGALPRVACRRGRGRCQGGRAVIGAVGAG